MRSPGCCTATGVANGMDGRGGWRDNVFVERLWYSVKSEEVYQHPNASVSAAKAGVGRYLDLYNSRRPHTAPGDRTPDEAYFTQRTLQKSSQKQIRVTHRFPACGETCNRREFTYEMLNTPFRAIA
jgi:hypothetical protein